MVVEVNVLLNKKWLPDYTVIASVIIIVQLPNLLIGGLLSSANAIFLEGKVIKRRVFELYVIWVTDK